MDYRDMIDLPHHVSKKRVQMPKSNRAAQFAPFAALTGFDGAIRETERLTENEIFLAEDGQSQLNEKLLKLRQQMDQQPQVKLTCFQRDLFKSGGSYISVTGCVKHIDEANRAIFLTDGERIPFGCIYDIE